jgi:hypothetical protein
MVCTRKVWGVLGLLLALVVVVGMGSMGNSRNTTAALSYKAPGLSRRSCRRVQGSD